MAIPLSIIPLINLNVGTPAIKISELLLFPIPVAEELTVLTIPCVSVNVPTPPIERLKEVVFCVVVVPVAELVKNFLTFFKRELVPTAEKALAVSVVDTGTMSELPTAEKLALICVVVGPPAAAGM